MTTSSSTSHRVRIYVCASAKVNQDGTFAVERGGLEWWEAERLPLSVSIGLLFEVEPGLPPGQRRAKVTGTNPTGSQFMTGDLLVLSKGAASPIFFASMVNVPVEAHGAYRFSVDGDGLRGEATLEIRAPGALAGPRTKPN